MKNAICPHCNHEIAVPNSLPDTMICANCKQEFEVSYKELDLNFAQKSRLFCRKHKKAIVGSAIAVIGIVAAYFQLHDIADEIAAGDSTSCDTASIPDKPILDITYQEDAEFTCMDDSLTYTGRKEPSHKELDKYDAVEHDIPQRIVNMGENRFPSMEKIQQARELGIELGEHQTICNSYSQTYYVNKAK